MFSLDKPASDGAGTARSTPFTRERPRGNLSSGTMPEVLIGGEGDARGVRGVAGERGAESPTRLNSS
jgi:hypothetical protein